MNGYERTEAFLTRKAPDRAPCHPILMRWSARHADVPYRDFCLVPEVKCDVAIKAAADLDIDWVTVMSDPYAEASAFGLQVEYPENSLPVERGGHLQDRAGVRALTPYAVDGHARLRGRVTEIELLSRKTEGRYFIVGWVEGALAEYADLRGATATALDLCDDPDTVADALDVITEAALPFITRQVEAGAHCIGIGDAFCSQIGPDRYRALAFPRERVMVEHIHALGARAKLHICGNTSALLPDMIRTGADIIDVDHLVPSLSEAALLLGPEQVLCGKVDPVTVVQNGTAEDIVRAARADFHAAGGRCIVSAGCEITPDTTTENIRALRHAASPFHAENDTENHG